MNITDYYLVRCYSVRINAHPMNTQVLTPSCTVIIARGAVRSIPLRQTTATGMKDKNHKKLWDQNNIKAIQQKTWRLESGSLLRERSWSVNTCCSILATLSGSSIDLTFVHIHSAGGTLKCHNRLRISTILILKIIWVCGVIHTCQFWGQRQWKESKRFRQVPVFWHGLLLQVFCWIVWEKNQ